jgi:hypothetical protein
MTRRFMKDIRQVRDGRRVFVTTLCPAGGPRRLIEDTGRVYAGRRVFAFADCRVRSLGDFPDESCVSVFCCPDPLPRYLKLTITVDPSPPPGAADFSCMAGEYVLAWTGGQFYEATIVPGPCGCDLGFSLQYQACSQILRTACKDSEFCDPDLIPDPCINTAFNIDIGVFPSQLPDNCNPYHVQLDQEAKFVGGATTFPINIICTIQGGFVGGGPGSGEQCLGPDWRTVGCCPPGTANALPPTLCAFVRRVTSPGGALPDTWRYHEIVERQDLHFVPDPDYPEDGGYWYGEFGTCTETAPLRIRLFGGGCNGSWSVRTGEFGDTGGFDVVDVQCRPFWTRLSFSAAGIFYLPSCITGAVEADPHTGYVIEISNPAETGDNFCIDPAPSDVDASEGGTGGGDLAGASPLPVSIGPANQCVTVPCCPDPIPRALYATIFFRGVGSGTLSVPITFNNPAAYPGYQTDAWYGYADKGPVCDNAYRYVHVHFMCGLVSVVCSDSTTPPHPAFNGSSFMAFDPLNPANTCRPFHQELTEAQLNDITATGDTHCFDGTGCTGASSLVISTGPNGTAATNPCAAPRAMMKFIRPRGGRRVWVKSCCPETSGSGSGSGMVVPCCVGGGSPPDEFGLFLQEGSGFPTCGFDEESVAMVRRGPDSLEWAGNLHADSLDVDYTFLFWCDADNHNFFFEITCSDSGCNSNVATVSVNCNDISSTAPFHVTMGGGCSIPGCAGEDVLVGFFV